MLVDSARKAITLSGTSCWRTSSTAWLTASGLGSWAISVPQPPRQFMVNPPREKRAKRRLEPYYSSSRGAENQTAWFTLSTLARRLTGSRGVATGGAPWTPARGAATLLLREAGASLRRPSHVDSHFPANLENY